MQAAETDDGMHHIESRTHVGEGKDGRVLHHRATVHFRVLFDDCGAGDERRGANSRVSTDKSRRHDAGMAMDTRPSPHPHSGLDLLADGTNGVGLEKSVDGKLTEV